MRGAERGGGGGGSPDVDCARGVLLQAWGLDGGVSEAFLPYSDKRKQLLKMKFLV